MPRLADETREERRARFIEAASRCSARKGYRSLTIDDVCAEAGGLSKGAFYTYFRSKQEANWSTFPPMPSRPSSWPFPTGSSSTECSTRRFRWANVRLALDTIFDALGNEQRV